MAVSSCRGKIVEARRACKIEPIIAHDCWHGDQSCSPKTSRLGRVTIGAFREMTVGLRCGFTLSAASSNFQPLQS
jgi:hypothetical protein